MTVGRFAAQLFDRDAALVFELLGLILRERDGQNAGLVLRLYVLGLYITHIKASRAYARVTLLTNDAALLVLLVLVKALLSADAQVTVLDIKADLVLFEAREINGQLVAAVLFVDIGLHQILAMLAVQRAVLAEEVVAEKVFKYVFTENTGYHNQCLQFVFKSLCRCGSLLRRAQA